MMRSETLSRSTNNFLQADSVTSLIDEANKKIDSGNVCSFQFLDIQTLRFRERSRNKMHIRRNNNVMSTCDHQIHILLKELTADPREQIKGNEEKRHGQ